MEGNDVNMKNKFQFITFSSNVKYKKTAFYIVDILKKLALVYWQGDVF
ncbi:MAG: hypothetical protein ACJAYB_002005 [Psychromonas sp.]|jgi:hypothetical protein